MDPMWPTIVAVSIFLLFAVVMLTAMRRYTFEQAMKIWQAEVGLLGTIIGMIGTFFFAQVSMSNLANTRDAARLQARQALATSEKLEQARQQIAGELIQRDDELRVAKLEAGRFSAQLALAEEKWDSLNTCLRMPAFRETVFSAYTTTQPTSFDMIGLINKFAAPEREIEKEP